ncbi:TetR/AcrR family transcriptional regulator [Celerinatantimonas yamalensis]|uniref:TetR family transcriptional regulator n=1 Tax=Celerinatantimonas yamalensis TaxID=559956 RepID=A0ABW9G762_9GAMM
MSNLRERRRLETAREIQQTTIELIQKHGFDQVTTGAISRHLGISHRTFFNYYANKESALIGLGPKIPEEAIARFLANSDQSNQSLKQLMLENTLDIEPHRTVLLTMQEIINDHPKVSQLQLVGMAKMREELGQVLAQKYPDSSPLALNILAEILLYSSWTSVLLWLNESVELELAFEKSWSALGDVTKVFMS